MKAKVIAINPNDFDRPVSNLLPGEDRCSIGVRLVITAAEESSASHRHDLMGALARVQAIQSALHRGYKFDDSQAGVYLRLFGEAIDLLKEEMEVLSEIYK